MKALAVGSAHLDILARPFAESSHKDRIVSVMIEVGGTACNVALSLRQAGMDVRMLTAWGDAPVTRLIESHIRAAGVELVVDLVADMPLAAFVAHLTVTGDLDKAISSTPVETHDFSAALLDECLNGVDFVVLETNLKPTAIELVAKMAKARNLPVFALGVSEDKVCRILAASGLLDLVFVNHIESEKLLAAIGAADPLEVAEHLAAPLVVTRGERGAVVYQPNGERVRILPPDLPDIKTLLGVGDAFSAGIIYARMQYALKDFIRAAEMAHEFVCSIARLNGCNPNSVNAMNRLVGSLYENSTKDKLTGLPNRRFFEEEYFRYKGGTNVLLVIDCDKFKQVNDTQGHDAGDAVLQSVANVITHSVRSVDLPCRWGGDEFAVLLPRTEMAEAEVVARRIQQAALDADLKGVTLSIGLAVASQEQDLDLKDLFNRADDAMYSAKLSGRNMVVCAGTC